jgi:hypothetical protein
LDASRSGVDGGLTCHSRSAHLPSADRVGSRNAIAALERVVRSATMPRRDPLAPLPPPAPRTRSVQVGRAHGGPGRARDRRAATRGCNPPPAGQTPGLPRIRQGVPRGREQGSSAGGVGRVPSTPRDPPPLAPPARRPEVDPAASPSRKASRRPRGPGADPPPGEGEPKVGLPADTGRASQARGQGLGNHDSHGA